VSASDSASEDAPDENGADAHDAGGKELTIQQASELLGVPAPTIRSWERRYGVPLAGRSSGGHRRYAEVQLDQLARMRDLIGQGRRAVEAAALVKAGHATSPGPLVDAFLRAALELAPGSIARTLDAARETLGLDRTVDEVLLPAMRQVGERWHSGGMDVAHEHLATNAAQAWLAALHPTTPLRPHPPIILSCGPLDHHTLGLEAIAALLRVRNWDCRLLGARTPAESLIRAAAETDAVAVVLVSHIPAARPAAVEALHSVQLRQRHVFYAGGAFESPRARQGVPGHYLGTNLSHASEVISATLSAT
jgi:methanogenic corrinoid protein MtbC1